MSVSLDKPNEPTVASTVSTVSRETFGAISAPWVVSLAFPVRLWRHQRGALPLVPVLPRVSDRSIKSSWASSAKLEAFFMGIFAWRCWIFCNTLTAVSANGSSSGDEKISALPALSIASISKIHTKSSNPVTILTILFQLSIPFPCWRGFLRLWVHPILWRTVWEMKLWNAECLCEVCLSACPVHELPCIPMPSSSFASLRLSTSNSCANTWWMASLTNDEGSILNTNYDRLRIGTSWDSWPGRFHPPVVQVTVFFMFFLSVLASHLHFQHLQIQRSSGAIGQIHPAPQKVLIDLLWIFIEVTIDYIDMNW